MKSNHVNKSGWRNAQFLKCFCWGLKPPGEQIKTALRCQRHRDVSGGIKVLL